MSLRSEDVLSSVRNRLLTDATINANIGKTGSDQGQVWLERIPASATNDKPTVVIGTVGEPETATFDHDAIELTFDLHLFYGNSPLQAPHETGTDCGAILDAARARLNRWVPSASGMTCSAVWYVNKTSAHDEDSWHWVQTYRVVMTET